MKNNLASIHTKFEKEDPYCALSIPVYNSVAYEFETAEQMEEAFCGRTPDHVYSRVSNPTVQYFEEKVRQITGAYSVTALNSGMAAISNAIMNIAWSGCNIVTSPHLFGNTWSLLSNTLASFGVKVRFCDLTNPVEIEKNCDGNTCAIFLEILTNPQLEVADLSALSAIAIKKGIPLVADSTAIPFTAFGAQSFGVDIEIVSSTKYISGGATSLGGLIIDYGTFDWSNSPKLCKIAGTGPYHLFTFKLKKEIHRNLGAYMTPNAAYMQSLGLESLALRYEKQSRSCSELATLLISEEKIENVNYTGFPDNKFYALSKKQFGEFPGAMFTIDLPSKEEAFAFMNRLKIIKRATNLFDNKTLAIHPATTIFGTFSESQRSQMSVSQKTIRISLGLEDIGSLFNDIKQAL